jgi:predicted nuclease of restriction endonuclease-like RecB superfamily
MITGISTKEEVLQFFIKWYDKEFTVIDDDDSLVRDLMIASADDLITEDVDYWANEYMRKLYQSAKSKLLGE